MMKKGGERERERVVKDETLKKGIKRGIFGNIFVVIAVKKELSWLDDN